MEGDGRGGRGAADARLRAGRGEVGKETGVWTGGHGVGSGKSNQRKVGRGLVKEDSQVKRDTADRPIDGAWAERGSR